MERREERNQVRCPLREAGCAERGKRECGSIAHAQLRSWFYMDWRLEGVAFEAGVHIRGG